jgi:hypothetical protein
MTTSATKMRALCVVTRCTSVEQFVATFHRFCDDDKTFFVATMTSRPVGLETAFSIELADKQPVLRGLCVVLNAWDTPDNRYKRPGIRLGIKRLTNESQIVFDRLRAASKGLPAAADATPPPGPLSTSPLPAAAPVLRPPAFPLRAATDPPALPVRLTPDPPPLPRVPALRSGPPPARATASPSAAGARSPSGPSTLPLFPSVLRSAIPAETKPDAGTPDSISSSGPASPPDISAPQEPSSSSGSESPAEPSPVTVTRFQVALNVGATPPPVNDLEFKPTQLPPRARTESKITSDPARSRP